MQSPTVESLRYQAKHRGAIGFDYWTNGAGDIDLYRFRYDWEGKNITPHESNGVSITPPPSPEKSLSETTTLNPSPYP